MFRDDMGIGGHKAKTRFVDLFSERKNQKIGSSILKEFIAKAAFNETLNNNHSLLGSELNQDSHNLSSTPITKATDSSDSLFVNSSDEPNLVVGDVRLKKMGKQRKSMSKLGACRGWKNRVWRNKFSLLNGGRSRKKPKKIAKKLKKARVVAQFEECVRGDYEIDISCSCEDVGREKKLEDLTNYGDIKINEVGSIEEFNNGNTQSETSYISNGCSSNDAVDARAEKIWQLGKMLGLKARKEQDNKKILEQFKDFIKESDQI